MQGWPGADVHALEGRTPGAELQPQRRTDLVQRPAYRTLQLAGSADAGGSVNDGEEFILVLLGGRPRQMRDQNQIGIEAVVQLRCVQHGFRERHVVAQEQDDLLVARPDGLVPITIYPGKVISSPFSVIVIQLKRIVLF